MFVLADLAHVIVVFVPKAMKGVGDGYGVSDLYSTKHILWLACHTLCTAPRRT